MKNAFFHLFVASAYRPQVDHNKRFLSMVRVNIMFENGGG